MDEAIEIRRESRGQGAELGGAGQAVFPKALRAGFSPRDAAKGDLGVRAIPSPSEDRASFGGDSEEKIGVFDMFERADICSVDPRMALFPALDAVRRDTSKGVVHFYDSLQARGRRRTRIEEPLGRSEAPEGRSPRP